MIKLEEKHIKFLQEHVNNFMPEIVCGAIIGSAKNGILTVDSLLKLNNDRYENRNTRFLISPDQYEFAEKTAAESNLELMGFYYSNKLNKPSEYDLNHALPGLLYLIISPNDSEYISSAWILNKNRRVFEEQKIEIIKMSEINLPHKMAIAV